MGAGYIFVSMLISMTSILLGQGRPGPVAYFGFVCSWLVALPSAYVFAFRYDAGLSGLWYGIDMGYAAYAALCGALVYYSDWTHLAWDAVTRSEVPAVEPYDFEDPAHHAIDSKLTTLSTFDSPLRANSPALNAIAGSALSLSPRVTRV